MMPSLIRRTTWLLAACLVLSALVSFSCSGNGSKDTDSGGPEIDKPDVGAGSTGSAAITEALAKGKAEGKVVMVELFDDTCPSSVKMTRVVKKDTVQAALSNMVYLRVTPEDRDFIKEFEITQVPVFAFFKPSGEFMPEMLIGYRSSRRFIEEINNFQLIADGKEPKALPESKHPDFGKT